MTSPIAQLRVTILPLMLFPVILTIALGFVVTGDPLARPSDPGQFVMAGVIAASVLLLTYVGYRTPAVPTNLAPDEAARRGVEQFRATAFVRLAFAEVPVMVGVALTFATEHGLLLMIPGALATLVLMGWHVLPSDSQIAKVQQGLEADGARVPLREAMHAQPAR